MEIYSIGHSTHSMEDFSSLLKAYKIELLVDVRSYPGSRHVPQFDKEEIEKWLPESGIGYLHMPALGGRRKKNHEIDNSLIDGWRSVSFQNYAAYSLTNEYEKVVNNLLALGSEKRVCLMCSESVPWRCHRLIISNTLTLKGWTVRHIMTEKKTILHELNLFGAKPVVKNSKLIYPKQPKDKDEEERKIKK